MGEDFNYQDADMWFVNLDKLIRWAYGCARYFQHYSIVWWHKKSLLFFFTLMKFIWILILYENFVGNIFRINL